MGRKLDLSGLSDYEAAHVLQVVQRDMRLRKKEEERLSEIKQELDEEGSRCLLLSRQNCFNRRCCIRCCSPFSFLLNPKRQCRDCGYNVCRACRVYSKRYKGWLCSACQKTRLLKTQSLEWFYTNVKRRFKRFGSAKVLKTLYRKHLTEHSILSELTEGSGYEESICNDSSICGSDSTFYRQSEEHSMAETLTVARRVAEEAIDEAISKAEIEVYCPEKQNEAHYLREHRGELIEELAKTIVQKIISRRKTLAEIKCEYDQDWTEPQYEQCFPSHQQGLWRSHSAFSLLDNDPQSIMKSPLQTLKKEGTGTSLSAWKSVDRLDNSVLKSPDGNWIALQSGQLSRPSLLTKRKSLVYSALERESGAVSAYEGMDSDNEIKPEPDSSWGAVLKEIHRKMTESSLDLLDDQDLVYTGGRRGSRDSEGNYWKSNKALLNRKVPAEIRKPSSSRRTSVIDINFNVEGGAAEESGAAAEPEETGVRRSRKKKKSKKETAAASTAPDQNNKYSSHDSSDAATPETLTSGEMTPELFALDSDITGQGANQINQELTFKLQHLTGQVSISDSSTRDDDAQSEGARMESNNGEDGDEAEEIDDEVKDRLFKLVAQSRLMYLSSTDDDLDRAGQSDEEDTQQSEGLTFKLERLEREVKATQFSSTEDELDRVGISEDVMHPGEGDEELAVKVCKLASQVNAVQFSSTEDELDRVGTAEEAEEDVDEAALWKIQAETGTDQTAQVRDLAGLVSICQFSSTEDELDRVGQDEAGQNEVKESMDLDRRESIGDLDVDMFELKEDGEVGNTWEDDGEISKVKSLEEDEGEAVESRLTERSESEKVNEKVLLESKEQEKQTEAKMDREERGESGESDPTEHQTVSDSEEDEDEFNRIINSMLMMTLEDMQVGAEGFREELKEPEDNVTRGGNDDNDRIESEVRGRVQSGVNKTPAAANEEETESPIRDNDGNDSGKTCGDINGQAHSKEEIHLETCETDEIVKIHKTKQDCWGITASEMMEAQKESSATDTETEEMNVEQRSVTSAQDGLLSPEDIHRRYSAVSLCSITTEVLKVLNATEQLLQGVEGEDIPQKPTMSLPRDTDPKKLDEQFSRLEENVYVAAGSVYGLETELNDLEECARAISSSTSNMELSFLEEQVASAAAKVQQSELQIVDISARIAALRSAGLNVDPKSRITKSRSTPVKTVTLDSSRHQRRLLPAPPVKDHQET